jgi:hypothetical protein
MVGIEKENDKIMSSDSCSVTVTCYIYILGNWHEFKKKAKYIFHDHCALHCRSRRKRFKNGIMNHHSLSKLSLSCLPSLSA